jgi:hypothetical protein
VLASSRSKLAYEGSTNRIAPGVESVIAGRTILTGGKAMAAELEVVVDWGVSGEKPLSMPGWLEPQHVALPPSRRLERDLTAVIEISALPMFSTRQDFSFSSAIRSEFIRHNDSRHVAQALQKSAKEAQGRRRVATSLNQNVKSISVQINRSPEIVEFASMPSAMAPASRSSCYCRKGK